MGFKVTRDFITKKDEVSYAVGIESVRQTGFNAMFMSEEEQKQCEYHGGKIKVRLKDDDGNIYYHGVVDDDDFSCELFLQWGLRYAGSTDLDMHIDDYKKFNGEEIKHPELVSKDGKWFYYMG